MAAPTVGQLVALGAILTAIVAIANRPRLYDDGWPAAGQWPPGFAGARGHLAVLLGARQAQLWCNLVQIGHFSCLGDCSEAVHPTTLCLFLSQSAEFLAGWQQLLAAIQQGAAAYVNCAITAQLNLAPVYGQEWFSTPRHQYGAGLFGPLDVNAVPPRLAFHQLYTAPDVVTLLGPHASCLLGWPTMATTTATTMG